MSVARLVMGGLEKRLEQPVRRDAALGRERAGWLGFREREEWYRSVGEYDAVLRGHCRLDGEGEAES